MEEHGKQNDARSSSLGSSGNFWIRFTLGAIAVFVIWFFVIRPNTIELSWAEQEQLLVLSREQLIASVAGNGLIEIYPSELSDRILRDGAAFVTLTVDGTLRGCMIDQFETHEPLVINVLRNVGLAAGADDRFPALSTEEVDQTRITVSIVYDIETLTFDDEYELLDQLKPNRDGVILEVDGNIATYLPSVWETFPEPAELLSQLCIKAGWNAERWKTEPYPTIQRYQIYEVAESE